MTLPILLAAAQAAQPGITERFGLEPKYIVMQVISFLIVLAILYKFGIKPVTATMEERARKIEAGIRHAEEMQLKLAAAQQESAAIVRQANADASRIVDDARKGAKEFMDRQTREASEKAAELLSKAQQAIDLEHRKMLADARTEIARLVVTTTERVLSRRLTETDRTAYNEAAVRELTEIKN